jgi:hypothetical protein
MKSEKARECRLYCRAISRGAAEGELIVSKKNFSFLGDVDPESGVVTAQDSDIYGKNISGMIFAFPAGRGSTVGTYVLLRMKKAGTAPLAIINEKTEPIIAVGAIISEIPLVDSVDISSLESGQRVRVVARDECYVELV